MTEAVDCLASAVSAGEPQLDVDTAEQRLREGETIKWTCTSSGGNPAPSVTWYRNGWPVNDTAAEVTPPAAKFGDTVGSLTWTLTADDHLANFSCSVSTPDIDDSQLHSSVASYRVQCQYVVDVTPRTKKVWDASRPSPSLSLIHI